MSKSTKRKRSVFRRLLPPELLEPRLALSQLGMVAGGTILQLTKNDWGDTRPQLDQGEVVWIADREIALYDGETIRQLTESEEGTSHFEPRIDNGQVAWLRWRWPDVETPTVDVFLYDGSSVRQLTDETNRPHPFEILDLYDNLLLDNGQVVWLGNQRRMCSGLTSAAEVFWYDGSSVRSITGASDEAHILPQIDAGQIAWIQHATSYLPGCEDRVGESAGVYVYDGSGTRRLLDTPTSFVKIDAGQIVWYEFSGLDASRNAVYRLMLLRWQPSYRIVAIVLSQRSCAA